LLHYAGDTNANLANMKFANCATLEIDRVLTYLCGLYWS